ncbi:MAG: hypothetical protein ACLFR0_03190 [Alphaproteobacteria bacterium]
MILCHCRNITDADLKRSFEEAKSAAPDKDVALEDLTPALGDFDCGGCRRIFTRAAEQFNSEGEINLFKRSRRKSEAQNGLCDYARSQKYSADGVPDLLGSPFDGEPI